MPRSIHIQMLPAMDIAIVSRLDSSHTQTQNNEEIPSLQAAQWIASRK